VRVETAPGDQLQVDFGQKRLLIAGVRVRIFLLVAVLSYSRRLFMKAFLNERGANWREGIAAAWRRAAHDTGRQCAAVGPGATARRGP
jgi:transposase